MVCFEFSVQFVKKKSFPRWPTGRATEMKFLIGIAFVLNVFAVVPATKSKFITFECFFVRRRSARIQINHPYFVLWYVVAVAADLRWVTFFIFFFVIFAVVFIKLRIMHSGIRSHIPFNCMRVRQCIGKYPAYTQENVVPFKQKSATEAQRSTQICTVTIEYRLEGRKSHSECSVQRQGCRKFNIK